jgi:hypothetical protein
VRCRIWPSYDQGGACGAASGAPRAGLCLLTAASQRLPAKVDAFRVRKETINASYTADEAAETVREAIAVMQTLTSWTRLHLGKTLHPGPARRRPRRTGSRMKPRADATD